MRTYRPPRVGDLLAVRTTDPYLPESQVVIHTVMDNGGHLLMAGRWGENDIEVLVRRIGDTQPEPCLET